MWHRATNMQLWQIHILTTGRGAVMEADRERKLCRKRRRCAASTRRSACAVIVLLNCDTLCSRLSPCRVHVGRALVHRPVKVAFMYKSLAAARVRQQGNILAEMSFSCLSAVCTHLEGLESGGGSGQGDEQLEVLDDAALHPRVPHLHCHCGRLAVNPDHRLVYLPHGAQ
jgi:hypothetical protein